MESIPSFQIDHRRLVPGVYVSRIDMFDDWEIVTFDMRVKQPYVDNPMDTASIHTIEHLGATFLRNDEHLKDKVIYFGPMGCRTGFYLIMANIPELADYNSEGELMTPLEQQGLDIVRSICRFILDYDNSIPGIKPTECGNCFDHNLSRAKRHIKKYYKILMERPCTRYPE